MYFVIFVQLARQGFFCLYAKLTSCWQMPHKKEEEIKEIIVFTPLAMSWWERKWAVYLTIGEQEIIKNTAHTASFYYFLKSKLYLNHMEFVVWHFWQQSLSFRTNHNQSSKYSKTATAANFHSFMSGSQYVHGLHVGSALVHTGYPLVALFRVLFL